MITIINIFLTLLGSYFFIGFLFGIFFIFKGEIIDPLLSETKRKVRFLLFFGVIATWPFLLRTLFHSKSKM